MKKIMSLIVCAGMTLTLAPVCTAVHAETTLESITITTGPNKTEYAAGESFDPTGMTVTATYADATTETVDNYTYSPDGALADTDTEITVSYEEKTATQAITVTAIEETPVELDAVLSLSGVMSEDSSTYTITAKLNSPDTDHTVEITEIEEENDGDITATYLNNADLTTFTYPATADGTYHFTVIYLIKSGENIIAEGKTTDSSIIVSGIGEPDEYGIMPLSDDGVTIDITPKDGSSTSSLRGDTTPQSFSITYTGSGTVPTTYTTSWCNEDGTIEGNPKGAGMLEVGTINNDGSATLTMTPKADAIVGTHYFKVISDERVSSAIRYIITSQDLTITGGTVGTNYTYTGGVLTITSGGPYTIENTDGVASTTDYISVNATADITIILSGITINNSANDNPSFIISNTGTTIVTLAEGTTNTLTAGGSHAGLENGTSSLTINGTGTLNATGHGNDMSEGGAGIGGSALGTGNGSNITIESGIVVAIGGSYAAGIGGGDTGHSSSEGTGSNITINGGDVTAKGGYCAAGIGGANNGIGSNITINGGNVTATGGNGGAGIGGGTAKSGNSITITGGTVNASAYENSYGTGIGGGYDGSGVDIRISQAQNSTTKVVATSDIDAGIGGSRKSTGNSIVITGGDVTAIGRKNYNEGALGNTSTDGNTTISFGDNTTWYQWRASKTVSVLTADYNNSFIAPYAYDASKRAVQFSIATTHGLKITSGSNMTRDTSKGKETQTIAINSAMTEVVYTATTGYYFPMSYGSTTTGITVTVSNDQKSISVTGTTAANTAITLLAATARTPISMEVTMGGWTYGDVAKVPTLTEGSNQGDAVVTYTYYTNEALSTKTTTANSGATAEGEKPVNAGTYYVKAEAAEKGIYASGSGSTNFTIKKADQSAPSNLLGTNGGIVRTTAAMEYSPNGTDQWIACTEGSTAVNQGTWYVRYAGDKNHNASTTEKLSVTKEEIKYSISGTIASTLGKPSGKLCRNDYGSVPKTV